VNKTIPCTISLPRSLDQEVLYFCKEEHRTRSGLIQEAIRHYIELKKWRKLQGDISKRARKLGLNSDDDIEKLVDELRK